MDFEAAEAKMALPESDDEEEDDSEETSDTDADAPYVAPSQGTKEEEELVTVEQSLALKLGLKDKIHNPDLEDTDDEETMDVDPEDRDGPLLVQIRRKHLMEKDFSRFTFTQAVGETPADDIKTDKWVKQLLSATISKVEFREQCSLFKGKLANEIKDPLLRLIVQATRYTTLHEEYHFNKDWENEADQQEFRVLDALRKFINKEASAGDPEKVAESAVWQATTTGRANIQEMRTLYKGALRHAKRAIAANDQKFK